MVFHVDDHVLARQMLIRHGVSLLGDGRIVACGSTYGRDGFVLRLTSDNNKRYVKVRANANPYRPADAAYFWCRRHDAEATVRTLA